MLELKEGKVANRSPEQDLINGFIRALRASSNEEIRIDKLYNSNCKAKKFADIEFKSTSGQRWAIEAKSNESKDAHNTVHKIFGELLKETGRDNRDSCNLGILLPEDSVSFYSRLFQSIDRDKFIQFGSLIPIHSVFLYGASGVNIITWNELYSAH